MIFSCRNCGKHYRIDMSAYNGHAVRWNCAKCGQEHTLKESDDPDEAVVAVGQKGLSVKSNTEEIFTITSRSTRRENDGQSSPTVRSGGWYVTVLGKRQGPMSDYGLMELLAAGQINARTYIWRSPMATWVRMKDLREVDGLLAQAESGASGRRDGGAWQARNTSPGIDTGAQPPQEPSPWDSRITRKADFDEPTGKHGIRATPGPSQGAPENPANLADELYRGLTNPGMDPRDADCVPASDPSGPEYWHSPTPRADEPAVRDTRPAWGDEITQPGKKTAARRRGDRTTTIVVAVAISVVAVAAIIAGVVIFLNSGDRAASTQAARKPAAVQAVKPAPVQPAVRQIPAPAPAAAPAPVPAPAPVQAASPASGGSAAAASPGYDRPAAVPVVTPVTDGIFDESDLMVFVQEQVPGFSTCRTVMAKKVETAISVNLMFNVAVSGAIETLVITPINVDDPALNVCMQTIIRGWKFPAVGRTVGFKGTIAIP